MSQTGQSQASALAELLLDEAHEVDFLDHSAGADNNDWAVLADMTDPMRAGNNCHAATWAILAYVTEQIGLCGDQEMQTVEVVFSDGVHWFPVLTATDGTRWAIDPTVRQFHPAASFLTPVPLTEHLLNLNRWVIQEYRDTMIEVHIDGQPCPGLLPQALPGVEGPFVLVTDAARAARTA